MTAVVCQCGATKPAGRDSTCPTCGTGRDARNRVYKTKRWQTLRQHILTRDNHTCQCGECGGKKATTVGHIQPFLDEHDPLAWDETNLQAENVGCNSADANRRRGMATPTPPHRPTTPPQHDEPWIGVG